MAVRLATLLAVMGATYATNAVGQCDVAPFLKANTCDDQNGTHKSRRAPVWCVSHDTTEYRLSMTSSGALVLKAMGGSSVRTLWDQGKRENHSSLVPSDPALYVVPQARFLLLVATFTDTAHGGQDGWRRELCYFERNGRPVTPPITLSSGGHRTGNDAHDPTTAECHDTLGRILMVRECPANSSRAYNTLWAVRTVSRCGSRQGLAPGQVYVRSYHVSAGYYLEYEADLAGVLLEDTKDKVFFYIE